MYRVDGVSGLNVLTGIINAFGVKVLSATSKLAGHHSRLLGGAFGYRSANMLSIPFRGNGAHNLSDSKTIASVVLKIFWALRCHLNDAGLAQTMILPFNGRRP